MEKEISNIGKIVNEQSINEKIPAVISVIKPLNLPDSKGFWIRFRDGTYHNINCPGAGLPLSEFEESLKNGSATIASYKPFSKDLLSLIFYEDIYKVEQEKIDRLYE